MYSRILVAIDGTAHSGRALRHALGLAKDLSATLRIAHVVAMGWLGLGMELAIDTWAVTQARRAAGEKLLQDARSSAQATGLQVEVRLLEMETPTDHVAALIATEAADWPADLVILGTHGRRGGACAVGQRRRGRRQAVRRARSAGDPRGEDCSGRRRAKPMSICTATMAVMWATGPCDVHATLKRHEDIVAHHENRCRQPEPEAGHGAYGPLSQILDIRNC